jgi:CxxC motif-containing protein (DUF1111 family)
VSAPVLALTDRRRVAASPLPSPIASRLAPGQRAFARIGCARCHVPSLKLAQAYSVYSEPGPYNPPGTARRQPATRLLDVDLNSNALPQPRLTPGKGAIAVPAFTDFKLHDITDASDPDAMEPLNLNWPTTSPRFLAGNRRFLTRRLWAVGNVPSYYHDGRFTTVREAIVAHAGEAIEERQAFEQLTPVEQAAILEFLKTLQVLPPGTTTRVVDEQFKPRDWPTQVH